MKKQIGRLSVNAIVMLLDPSSLHVPFWSATGSKIDFCEGLGQNDKGWRQLGQGLGLAWAPGGATGRSASQKDAPELPIGRFLKSKSPRGNRVIFGRSSFKWGLHSYDTTS